MAKVTVVIPCYNHGAYLGDAVASAQSQAHPDCEIVIVDDASTDAETLRTIDQYSREGIKIVRNPHRSGPGAARNRGIEAATGKYILPLDADDKISVTYLQEAVAIMEADSQIGIVYSLAEFFGTQSGQWTLPPFELPRSAWEPGIFNCALFRREDWVVTNGYSEALNRAYEDHDFWLGILSLGRTVYRLQQVHFFYRRVPNSLAQSIDLEGKVSAYMLMIERHRDFMLAQLEGLVRGFLAREAVAQVWHQRPVAQVFLPAAGGFNEEASVRREYSAGEWRNVELPLPTPGPWRGDAIRIDPGMQSGGFDLESIEWHDDTRLIARTQFSQAEVAIGGTALKLAGIGFVRLLSFGKDPQCVVNGITIPPNATKIRIRLRFHPNLEAIADSLEAVMHKTVL